MDSIKISLIIPTRERAETLKFSIKTALNQNLKNYEVIVSDNFSNDSTKEVFDTFSDSRLKYFNTGKRLSMTENFNFALSKAKGEYIIVIGDDDGVMPNGIDKLHEFIFTHPSDLYIWPRHDYIWPTDNTYPVLRRFSKNSIPIKVNLRDKLAEMLKKGLLLNSLMPNTYHSATHRRIFDKIKNRTGKCYQTTNPDEFMLFTLPVFCEYFINIGEAITVDGHSPKSNSGSTFIKSSKNEDTELKKFVTEQSNYKIHRNIPSDFPRVFSFVLDTFMVARDMNHEFYSKYKINFSGMLAFGWTMFKFKNTLKPIVHRKKLQENESFNSIYYLFFTILFFIYMQISNKILFKSKFEKLLQLKFKEKTPMNVAEFVNFIDKNKQY
jgi:glycosyltransferase involved in cell wall biosynthesis